MKNICSLLIALAWGSSAAYAQEPQFSNFYATHLYTNPAFTGRSDYEYRFSANFRRQWHQIGSFSTAFVSADYAFHGFGLGLTAYADQAGSAPFRTVQGAISTSWGLRVSRQADLVIGFQGSYYDQRLGDAYTWIDDYLSNSPNTPATGINNQYFNLSAGLLLIHERFWLGASLKDALPNAGIHTNSTIHLVSTHRGGKEEAYYGRVSLHGGYYRYLHRQLFFSSYFNLRARATVRQWEGGVNLAYRPIRRGGHAADIVVGIGGGYRGFATTGEGLSTRDAVVLNTTFTWPEGLDSRVSRLWKNLVQVVYSYDITVSRLSGTGGAHEVTLSFKLSDSRPESSWPETQERRRHIPDPGVCKPGRSGKNGLAPR